MILYYNTRMESWHLYLLRCENGALYTGIAKNPFRRFDQHIKGKGARYTRLNPPLSLVHIETLASHSIALKRELLVKRFSKKRKEMLCQDSFYVYKSTE